MKPATPLPWHVLSLDTPFQEQIGSAYKLSCGENEIAIFRADGARTQEQDATYASHACNAYPRLVEALKYWVGNERDTSKWLKHIAFLRELGEL